MKAIIIEDELSNSKRLIKLINNIDSDIEILTTLVSVEDTVNWLNNNPTPNLIFMDIQLSDGICFEIFSTIKVDAPVIFTTAYDEYAIQAFKFNSIDYLLKPIDPIELERAIIKYKKMYSNNFTSNIDSLLQNINKETTYKNRLLVKHINHFIPILVENIAYFLIENQLVYIYTLTGQKYIYYSYLDDIEKILNPKLFFRINRQMIININTIKKINSYTNNRLILNITPVLEKKEIIVSREKVQTFKEWISQ